MQGAESNRFGMAEKVARLSPLLLFDDLKTGTFRVLSDVFSDKIAVEKSPEI